MGLFLGSDGVSVLLGSIFRGLGGQLVGVDRSVSLHRGVGLHNRGRGVGFDNRGRGDNSCNRGVCRSNRSGICWGNRGNHWLGYNYRLSSHYHRFGSRSICRSNWCRGYNWSQGCRSNGDRSSSFVATCRSVRVHSSSVILDVSDVTLGSHSVGDYLYSSVRKFNTVLTTCSVSVSVLLLGENSTRYLLVIYSVLKIIHGDYIREIFHRGRILGARNTRTDQGGENDLGCHGVCGA